MVIKLENIQKREKIGVEGFSVGGYTDQSRKSGITMFLVERPNTAGVFQSGGDPVTRDSDALRSTHRPEYSVDGLVFTGRSVFGLHILPEIVDRLSERNIGFNFGKSVVPTVPAAVIFDLHENADPPDPYWAQAAFEDLGDSIPIGSQWCGTGATSGKMRGYKSHGKGGQGYSALRFGNTVVGVFVVVNSYGYVFDYDGSCVSNDDVEPLKDLDISSLLDANPQHIEGEYNTTIGAVLTNAKLTHEEACYVAESANFGFASRIFPYSTGLDGDTVFAVSTNKVEGNPDQIAMMARKCAEEAVLSIYKKPTE